VGSRGKIEYSNIPSFGKGQAGFEMMSIVCALRARHVTAKIISIGGCIVWNIGILEYSKY
jgi:hypothetical protein